MIPSETCTCGAEMELIAAYTFICTECGNHRTVSEYESCDIDPRDPRYEIIRGEQLKRVMTPTPPTHDYLRKEFIKAGLACSQMLEENIDESEVFYEYCEAVADKCLMILENESVL